ncbi:TPA: HAMP domain-containing histidine kinase [Thermoplasmata archaeon]|nr:HAMP domain-containing histidine kinase [Thermoplasmata archaeon]
MDEAFNNEMSAVMDMTAKSGDVKSVLTEIAQSIKRATRAEDIWFEIHSDVVWGESLDVYEDEGPVRVQAEGFDRDCSNHTLMISPECYFSRPKAWARGEGAQASSAIPQWQSGDWFKFPLLTEGGKVFACLVVGGSSDGLLLDDADVARIGLFAKLASIVIARKRERIHFERLSDSMRQRAYLLEDVLTISSSIVSERSIENLSKMILSSVSTLFGFDRVSLVVFDDEVGAFRWKALFGYPEEVVDLTLTRTIPPDAVLDELVPANRVSRSAYHVPYEKIPEASKKYFVMDSTPESAHAAGRRRPDELREGDTLAFALHDSAGRIVGAIYPSLPRSEHLPEKEAIETIEIFTSLAEVAMEEARLSAEREDALRLSSQRAEQLSRIFDLISELMYVRDLDQLLDDVLKTLNQLLGLKRMTIGVRNDERKTFQVRAVHGYLRSEVETIKRVEFPIERVDYILDPDTHRSVQSPVKWRKKLGRRTYYMPAESVDIEPDDVYYHPNLELVKYPRKSKDHWHELDYLDTFIYNRDGVVVAYLELLKPRDDRVPDQETVEMIEIFASIIGIAIENSRMFQSQVDNRQAAEFYTDLLSHDIKNFNQAIMGYLDILGVHLPNPEQQVQLGKIADQVMNVSRLASDVRTLSRLTWSGVSLARLDLGSVLLDCMNSVKMYHLSRKIEIEHGVQPDKYFVNADELMRELFVNILTNAVKYDTNETVEIDVTIDRLSEGTKGWYVVSIADRGRGIPDDMKEAVFERFSSAPKRRGSSGLGLHIVKTLSQRYGGSAWVEDRVPGKMGQGSMFRVKLPES